jgi:hypothetical protein
MTWPLCAAELSMFAHMIALHGRELFAAAFEQQSITLISYDSTIPSDVRLAFLERLESSASLLGIFQAMVCRTRVEPWLALALAEKFRDGLRAHLCLLAAMSTSLGIPEGLIPETLVPRSARLDLGALERRRQAADDRLNALANAADIAPGGVLEFGSPEDNDL